MIACRAINNMAGGVERQAIALANEMTKRGHTVSLLTLDHQGAQAFYEINPAIKWYKLSLGDPKKKANLITRLKRMVRVRNILKEFRPGVILAFQQGMFLTLRLYNFGISIPIVAAERESPFRYDHIKSGKYKNLIFQTFRMASSITVQCESYVNAYPLYLRHKITVIPNPVFPTNQYANPGGQYKKEKILLCVGRLGFQKNQIVLIKAFSKLHKELPEWVLVLAGEGEGRKEIENLLTELNLKNKVKVLGAVKNVKDLYCESHLFCLPARWEGFPNALGEALAHGLPCVGYRGCDGVCDLIKHGYNGYLADFNNDVETLYQNLKLLMNDQKKRLKMGQNAIQSVEQYEPKVIYNIWEDFLRKAHEA